MWKLGKVVPGIIVDVQLRSGRFGSNFLFPSYKECFLVQQTCRCSVSCSLKWVYTCMPGGICRALRRWSVECCTCRRSPAEEVHASGLWSGTQTCFGVRIFLGHKIRPVVSLIDCAWANHLFSKTLHLFLCKIEVMISLHLTHKSVRQRFKWIKTWSQVSVVTVTK